LNNFFERAAASGQCEQLPLQRWPRPFPFFTGASPAELAANVENFFWTFIEPQCGHLVPAQSLERTRISLSFAHCSQ
jgi:hypothetical protein